MSFQVKTNAALQEIIDRTKKELGVKSDSELLKKLIRLCPSLDMLEDIKNDTSLPETLRFWASNRLFIMNGEKNV